MCTSIKAAEDLIRRRTSKIIGGYITEDLFKEKYRACYGNRMYSEGWWGGIENSSDKTTTFFVVKNELNPLDYRVIERLESQGYLWKQLIKDGGQWYVADNAGRMSIEEYICLRGLTPTREPGKKFPRVTGDDNLETCIDTFKRKGTLEKIAASIDIEDSFLNLYYVISNIDLICEDADGTPIYAEIKFKNGFTQNQYNGNKEKVGSKLVFGIDKFQVDNLFLPFYKCGMKVMNVILYDDVKQGCNVSQTVIFDFLREKENQNLIWKYKMIDPTEAFDTHTFSSGVTGWYGKTSRTVCCIPLREYRDLGDYSLPEEEKSSFPEGSWGICSDCGELKVIRTEHEHNREFFGCLDYDKHRKAVNRGEHRQ